MYKYQASLKAVKSLIFIFILMAVVMMYLNQKQAEEKAQLQKLQEIQKAYEKPPKEQGPMDENAEQEYQEQEQQDNGESYDDGNNEFHQEEPNNFNHEHVNKFEQSQMNEDDRFVEEETNRFVREYERKNGTRITPEARAEIRNRIYARYMEEKRR